jgi:hypothetical protein
MRAWIVGIAYLFLIHSSHAQPIKTPPQHLAIPSFSAVKIRGIMNVNLHTGYSTPALTLMGDPKDLANVKIEVVEDVLFISLKEPASPNNVLSVDIRTRYLNGLEYHGTGTITGDHLRANLERLVIDNHGPTTLKGTVLLSYVNIRGDGLTQISGVKSRHLHVKLAEHAKLRLTGLAALKHLEMEGNSWFSLAWIKTPTLILCASDKAYIELAGIVNKFDAKLQGSAKLNARYLRARRAFVKTHDNSVAEIAAIAHQHTLATDASDIRFYNLPDMKTDFMNFDGAVLDMRAFNTAYDEEPRAYDNYNRP